MVKVKRWFKKFLASNRLRYTLLAYLVAAILGGAMAVVLGVNIVLVELTLLTLAMVAWALMDPWIGLLLFLLWVPFVDFAKRLLLLPPGVTATWLEYQWVLALPDLVLIATAARAAYELFITRRLKYRLTMIDLPASLFLVWSFISIFNPNNSLYAALAGFKMSSLYILLYYLGALFLRERAKLDAVTRLAVVTAAIAATYALYQTIFGFRGFEWAWLRSGLTALGDPGSIGFLGIGKPFSTLASHEQLGWYLGIAALLSLTRKKPTRLDFVLLALLGLVVMRTLSRSSWVFFSLALLLVFFGSLWKRWKSLAGRSVFAGVILGLAFVLWTVVPVLALSGTAIANQLARPAPALVPTPAPGAPSPSSPSWETCPEGICPLEAENPFLERATTIGTYEVRIRTFKFFLKDPVWHSPFGNGIGSMWVAWRLAQPGTEQDTRPLSHVGTIDIAYELGLVGLLLFLWVMGTAVWQGIKHLHHEAREEGQWVALICLAVIIGTVVANSTVTTILIFRPIGAYFWLLIGALSRADGPRDTGKAERNRLGGMALRESLTNYAPVLFLGVLSFILGYALSSTYSEEAALMWDASRYWALAQDLREGAPLVALSGPPRFTDVGYPLVLAGIFELFGASVRVGQIANTIMVSTTCVFSFLAIRKLMVLLGHPMRMRMQFLISGLMFLSPLFLTFQGKLYSEILAANGFVLAWCSILHLWRSQQTESGSPTLDPLAKQESTVWPRPDPGKVFWSLLFVVGAFLFFVTKSAYFPLLVAYLIAFLILRKRALLVATVIALMIVLPFQAAAQRGGHGPYSFAAQVAKLNWSYPEIAASSVYYLSNTLGRTVLPQYENLFHQNDPSPDLPGYDRNPYVLAGHCGPPGLWQSGFSYFDGFRLIARDPVKYTAIVVATLPTIVAVEGIYPAVGDRLPAFLRLGSWLLLKLSLSLLLWFGCCRLLVQFRRNAVVWVSFLPVLMFVVVHGNTNMEQRYFFPLVPLLWVLALTYFSIIIATWHSRTGANE